MIEPLQQEFGWRRDQITFAPVIVVIITILLTPVVGYLVDRIGYRIIALTGLAVYNLSLLLISGSGPSIESWYFSWCFLGIGFALLQATWTTGVAKNFDRSRGVAISLCLLGTGFATILTPITISVIIEGSDWRYAYRFLACFGTFIILPIAWAWFRPVPNSDQSGDISNDLTGLDRAEIFRTKEYWTLAVICYLGMVSIVGMVIHFVPMLSDSGLELTTVATIGGMIGVGNVVGRLSAGFFLDRFHGKWVGVFAVCCPFAGALILLCEVKDIPFLLCAAFLIGVGNGVENDVMAYVSSRYFGLKNFGMAFTTLGAFVTLGHGSGSYIAGLLFEHFGNYHSFLLFSMSALMACLVLFLTLKPYPEFHPALDR